MVWRRSAHVISGGRPRGIIYLVAYYTLVGVGLVTITIWAIYFGRVIPNVLEGFLYNLEALVAIAVVIGGVHVWTAWGLWNLRGWARLLVIVLSMAGIVFGIFTLPLGFASIMLNLGTFWYITHHRVREAFVQAARPAS